MFAKSKAYPGLPRCSADSFRDFKLIFICLISFTGPAASLTHLAAGRGPHLSFPQTYSQSIKICIKRKTKNKYRAMLSSRKQTSFFFFSPINEKNGLKTIKQIMCLIFFKEKSWTMATVIIKRARNMDVITREKSWTCRFLCSLFWHFFLYMLFPPWTLLLMFLSVTGVQQPSYNWAQRTRGELTSAKHLTDVIAPPFLQ